MTAETRSFRVIVVGAGVAGLTTSHCLQKAGIDHVVIERRTDVAPLMGSSIAIYPNGCRILHQIDCLKAMEASCVPCRWAWNRRPDGKSIVDNGFFGYVKENHGHDVMLLERRQFLQNLYDCLPSKESIRLGCEVQDVREYEDGVEVILSDGSIERGDIVVGADGVRSPIRSIMWDHANKRKPGSIGIEEKKRMKTEWKLLLGMAPGLPELGASDMTVVHEDKYSFLTLTQPDHTYFFVFFKLDKPFSWPAQQRYTDADAEEAAASVAEHPLCETLMFGELWKKKQRASLISIEEGVLQHWFHDRIVLVGDGVHKMTPNVGLGGNMALESAVVLCNKIQEMLAAQNGLKPSRDVLNKAFEAYQEERCPRVTQVVDFSRLITQLQAWDTPFHKFYANWVTPFQSDRTVADMVGEIIRGGPKLAYVDTAGFPQGRLSWKDEKQNIAASKGGLRWAMSAVAFFTLAVGSFFLSGPTEGGGRNWLSTESLLSSCISIVSKQ